ncbi:MAG: TraR/DksA C4-type zinc finger protein, partial [Syntrophomonadaceae bacterium]|nr:TraR/DksA C4-type zinc finger protein [Syntrophomonadaceae bacterium]
MDRKEQLEARREHLQEALRRKRELRTGSPGTRLGELSFYDQHPADLASDVYEQEKESGVELDLVRELNQVERALQRLQEGTYHLCERCGKEIDPRRQEALPEATLCVECARLKQGEDRFARIPPPVV